MDLVRRGDARARQLCFLRRYRKHGGEKSLCLVVQEAGGEPRMTLWARKESLIVRVGVFEQRSSRKLHLSQNCS